MNTSLHKREMFQSWILNKALHWSHACVCTRNILPTFRDTWTPHVLGRSHNRIKALFCNIYELWLFLIDFRQKLTIQSDCCLKLFKWHLYKSANVGTLFFNECFKSNAMLHSTAMTPAMLLGSCFTSHVPWKTAFPDFLSCNKVKINVSLDCCWTAIKHACVCGPHLVFTDTLTTTKRGISAET